MALSVYPHDSSKNLKSKSPPPQLIPDKHRQRGNSAAARPSLRLHIANPTERLPVADSQTRALYNVPAEPNPHFPAELRNRGASFTGKRSPSPQIRINNSNYHTISGNSTPSSTSGGSAASAKGSTAPNRQVPPQQMLSAGTVSTANTDDSSAFSGVPSNISTPATTHSAHPLDGAKNRSRPLPLPPPPSRPPSRGVTTPETRHAAKGSVASAPGGGQPQPLMFDPTTSTWVIKPPVMNSPLRSAPPSKLSANATYPQALNSQHGLAHGQHNQSFVQHHSSSNSISRSSHSQGHHGHSRSRSDQTRETPPLPKPFSTGQNGHSVNQKGKQPIRTAPNSDNEFEAQEPFSNKWKDKQPVHASDGRSEMDSHVDTDIEGEFDPDKLPGGKKWKGKEPIRGEGWHLMFPNASKNSSGLSVHTPPPTTVSSSTPPPPLPATAPVPGTAVPGAAASSSSSLDLPPSLSKTTTATSTSVPSLGPGLGRPHSNSSLSMSSRDSRDEGTTTSRWKGKNKEVVRRSGSVSSLSSYNSISGTGAGITKKTSKKGKGKPKGKNVVNPGPQVSYNNSPAAYSPSNAHSTPTAYGGSTPNFGPVSAANSNPHVQNLNIPLTSPYIPGVNAPHISAAASVLTTPTPVTVVPLPHVNQTPRSGQHLPSPPTSSVPDRAFTPSRQLPAEPIASSGTPPLPLPPSLQVSGGQKHVKPPAVPPKEPRRHVIDSTQARAMANDPFKSYTPENTSPNPANTNPHLLYVYREYRDADSDSISSNAQHDPVDIGYGYGEDGFEDDERVYVDDGYSGPNKDSDEEEIEGGFITAAGTVVDGGVSGTGSNSDLHSTVHGSSVYHGSTVHGSSVAHSVRSGGRGSGSTINSSSNVNVSVAGDVGEFKAPSLNERERDRSPSPMSFARRRKNSLDFDDDDDADNRYVDVDDEELSPGGLPLNGMAGYETQGYGNAGIPVASPVPRRPGISVTAMEEAGISRTGSAPYDWKDQLQDTVPPLPSTTGMGRGIGRGPNMQTRGDTGSSGPSTPSGGLTVDFDPSTVLGPEEEMVFSKNPSPTRYNGHYKSPFMFGEQQREFVRGRWRLRSPSPSLSPLDLGPDEVSHGMLSPGSRSGSGNSAPLSPITFTPSSAGNSLSPLSGPNSPIRRQKTNAQTLGVNLGASARQLRRYASEESLLVDPNPATTAYGVSHSNFNNNYTRAQHLKPVPMQLTPNRYVEPERPAPEVVEAKPKKSTSSSRPTEYDAMGQGWFTPMDSAVRQGRGVRRERERGATTSGNPPVVDGSNGSGGGRKRGTSVPKVTNGGHGQVLTKQHRAPMDRDTSYDVWIENPRSKRV
ncbi:hypothetical protein VKT23_012684 [Stygiomarasmius scandens]|uniref:Uncharacterized protein n=1 Tax=Marasmiellus scandens TaxID=2682957 RepID=A0ABR1J4X7_9AGAR